MPKLWWRYLRLIAVGALLSLIVYWAYALRISDLGRNYLEANEGGTFFLSMAPFEKYLVWGGTESDFTGAESEWNGFLAYYGLFHAAQSWLGLDEFSLRVIPMFCGVLGVVAIFFLGRRLGGNWAGLMAAFCLAFNFDHSELSRYYRFNSLNVLLVIISTHVLLEAVKHQRLWSWIAYWFTTWLCLLSMVLSLFVMPVHWIYIWLETSPGPQRRLALGGSVAAVALALIPSQFFDSVALQRIVWYPMLSLDRWAELWGALMNIWRDMTDVTVPAYVVLYLCFLGGFGYATWCLLQRVYRRAELNGLAALVFGWTGWRNLIWGLTILMGISVVCISSWDIFGHDTTQMFDRGLHPELLALGRLETWIKYLHASQKLMGGLGLFVAELGLVLLVWDYLPAKWRGFVNKLASRWHWGDLDVPSPEQLPSYNWGLVWMWLVLPFAAMAWCTILVKPILLTRNVCFLIPPVALLVGCGFARFNLGGKLLTVCALALAWPGLNLAQCGQLDPVPERLDGWTRVVETIQARAHDGDNLVLKSVNGPSYRYYVYLASRYLPYPKLRVWPEFAWNGSPCPLVAFPRGQEFVRRILKGQTLWVISDEQWFSLLRLCDEDLRDFKVEERWFFSFDMQLTRLTRIRAPQWGGRTRQMFKLRQIVEDAGGVWKAGARP